MYFRNLILKLDFTIKLTTETRKNYYLRIVWLVFKLQVWMIKTEYRNSEYQEEGEKAKHISLFITSTN